jgi:Carboxypeptidase regulatory-like domain
MKELLMKPSLHHFLLSTLLSVLILFAGLLAAPNAWSQGGSASLRGTITDLKGASVPGAAVTISNPDIGITLTTHTDKSGVYQFLEVRPSTYNLIISAAGFSTVKQSGLVLLVSTPTTNDIVMQISVGITTVEVLATTQAVNTQDATIGNAFNQSQISALPFEGRDPAAILSLQPGVVTVSTNTTLDQNSDSRGGSVNGARSDQTNVTLDGVDNNDQTKGYALKGALRATLDSIEEFRVTTTNAGAEQGRSSGAQVSIITRSGTNDLHGSAYEYNRPKNLVANDWFNKHAQLTNGEPNTPASLLRNTFGGSVGGAIKKDRIFYFAAYEGQRTREATQTSRTVPSDTLREGIMLYQCGDPTQCPGGTQQVQGIDTSQLPALTPKEYSVNVPNGYYALSSANIASMDPNCSANGVCPWGAGVNPNSLATMNQYPHANSTLLGDGFNYLGYTFSASTPNKLDTYVVKFDVNLTESGTQRLFVRLGLENDHGSLAPQFPGQDPAVVDTNNSKGIIVGYTWTISSTKVNNFRYGFIREGVGNDGSGSQSLVYLRGLDPITTDQRSTNYVVPVHNFADDYSWTRGKHTIQFGANWRYINDTINSNANSFSDATTNSGWLPDSFVAGTGGTLDPGAQSNGCDPTVCTWNFPAVSSGFGNGYDFPIMALVGPVTEIDAAYQRTKDGTLLPDGSIIGRHFRVNELDLYGQDVWRIRPNVTLTWGLRYSLLQPPYETNGNQVAPNIDLGKFFQQRIAAMDQGMTYSPTISVDLSGPANGKPGYWGWDFKDFAPRFALAWSPGATEGLWGSMFGGPGKSSIRLGAGIYYDHFGLGTVNTFDRNGSYGLTTAETSNFGAVDLDTAPRYTSSNLHDPSYGSLTDLFPPPPTGAFPQTPPTADQLGGFSPYWGLDSNMKTPYSYDLDLSFSREIQGGFVIEAAYVGRLGRRLLQERDLAQPLNIIDPQSKISYYQAASALTQLAEGNGGNGVDLSQIKQNPYWQNIFPGANGTTTAALQSFLGCSGPPNSQNLSTLNATQAIYYMSSCNLHNETTTLQELDLDCFPACPYINGQQTQGFQYFLSQFPSLFAWQSIGRSNYNAGQFSIRHKVAHGLQWDFNYVFSKSIDMGSNAERVSAYEGEIGLASLMYNAFQPGQNRSVSDYDATHQINSNWVYELPFGHTKKWGSGWNRAAQAVLGGWTISGLYRWTSGFPFSVGNGFRFPTNWDYSGNAVQIAPVKTGLAYDSNGNPNAFGAAATPGGVASLLPCTPGPGCNPSFRFAYAGESGARNNFRGQGFFGIDMALRKSWNITERQVLSFTYDVYNITNSVRFGFDATQNFPAIDTVGSFGNYNQTLTTPRVMEFALRYSF